MERSTLYVIIGTLAVLVIALGLRLEQERNRIDGVSIDIGGRQALSIEAKKN